MLGALPSELVQGDLHVELLQVEVHEVEDDQVVQAHRHQVEVEELVREVEALVHLEQVAEVLQVVEELQVEVLVRHQNPLQALVLDEEQDVVPQALIAPCLVLLPLNFSLN